MLKLFSRTSHASSKLRRRLDFASLQMRLTFGVVLGALSVFGVTVGWMMWKTEQMLFVQHQQALGEIMRQLPDNVPASSEKELSSSLQAVISQLSTPDTWIWFKSNRQQVLAQSPKFADSPIAADLLTVTESLPHPQILRLDDRVMMLQTYPLKHQGKTIGQCYVAQDITQSYVMLEGLTRSLQLAGIAAIALLSLFIVWFIQRSLRPLKHLNQATIQNSRSLPMAPNEVPTEVRELARAYSQLRDRLSESTLKQQQFTHSISHELRTPLSLVYGYLQSTLRRGPNLTESQQEALSIAVLETENIIQLLQELLEGARLEGAMLALEQESTLVNPIVEEAVRMVQQFDRRAVQIEAPDAVTALIDPDALLRVLAHLLDNAVRYSPSEQPITIRLFQEGDQTVIQVIDCGCGIDPSQQSLIFEPLYRAESSRSRSTGGAGLGLSIARSLVEGMGGTITVESGPGGGSTFTVKLRRISS